MTTISTHVLDLVRGGPAVGVGIILSWQDKDGNWQIIQKGESNQDGRLPGLLSETGPQIGLFRMQFGTGPWFTARGERCFYPEVQIHFEIPSPDQHWHVPLLMGPYGYSTYRGS